MLVGELRSYDKPANVVEAERIGRRAANDDDRVRLAYAAERSHPQPGNGWLDRVASLGLTLVLAVVLFLAVTALAQAGLPGPDRNLAQVPAMSASEPVSIER